MNCPVALWPFKGPDESFPVAFSYARELAADGLAPGESLVGTPTVVIGVVSGVDPNPDAMKATVPVIDGNQVVLWLAGGIAGVTYWLICYAQTSGGKTLARAAELPVEIPSRWNQYRRLSTPST